MRLTLYRHQIYGPRQFIYGDWRRSVIRRSSREVVWGGTTCGSFVSTGLFTSVHLNFPLICKTSEVVNFGRQDRSFAWPFRFVFGDVLSFAPDCVPVTPILVLGCI
jgi:hypothetical protein